MSVRKVTDEERAAVQIVTAGNLPDNPSAAGWKPDAIRAALSGGAVDGMNAALDQLNRVVDEVNIELDKKISKPDSAGELEKIPVFSPEGEIEYKDGDTAATAGTYAKRGSAGELKGVVPSGASNDTLVNLEKLNSVAGDLADDLSVSLSGNTLTVSLKHGDTTLKTEAVDLPFEGELFYDAENAPITYSGGALTFYYINSSGELATASVDLSGIASDLGLTTKTYVDTQDQAINSEVQTIKAAVPLKAALAESGYEIVLELDSTDYTIKAKLKNKAGEVITTSNTIDLPLETLVLDVSLDEDDPTQINVTLKNGTVVSFSIADLADGLVSLDTFNAHADNTDVHVSAEDRAKWYVLPEGGIPKSDLDSTTQAAIDSVSEKYALPEDGIPAEDLNESVQETLGSVVDKYEKPSGGIPKTDLASSVQDTLDAVDKKYVKPASGIPKTDLASGVQQTLENAIDDHTTLDGSKDSWDAKYDKPEDGIPSEDLEDDVQIILSNAASDHETIPGLALASESGYSISFSVNTSTYVLTAQLLNKAGTVLSTQTVDLPLESVVVSGSYDDTTKKVTLTLVSGSTVEFSIADLISGLVSTETFTAHTGDTTVHITAAERATWNNKADKNGVYDEMTVGTAKQILATVGVVEKVPYNFRTSGGAADINDRETDKIIGGTVVWNQLVTILDSSNYGNESGKRTFSNNTTTFTSTGSGSDLDNTFRLLSSSTNKLNAVAGHKYLVSFLPDVHLQNNLQYTRWVLGLVYSNEGTQKVSISKRDAGKLVSKIFEASTTKNVRYYLNCELPSGKISANGDYITTSNYQIYDLTKMFGPTIANYISDLETTTAGAGVAWFRKLFPKAYYSYNAGQLMSVKTSSHDMVGFNAYNHATGIAILLGGQEWQITGDYTALSYVDINGDSETITTDANGKFTPTNNGTLTVTGGNDTDTCVYLVWSGEHDNEYKPYVKHSYPLDPSLELRGFPKLATDNSLYYDGDEYEGSGQVTRKYGVRAYAEGDESDPDIMTDGTNTLYALTTPTTESAAPFANPQIVDDYGTEEYVDTREVVIPVGHETLYQANLRDKLQHLPSLYSVNGVVQSGLFHIMQDGTNMVLVPDTSDTRLNALEALVPVYEDYTIATTDWTALSSSDPYDYSATVTATHTIGSNTVVELVNNNPVLFATHGFAIGAVSGQNITIYAIGTPSASVSLEVAFNG